GRWSSVCHGNCSDSHSISIDPHSMRWSETSQTSKRWTRSCDERVSLSGLVRISKRSWTDFWVSCARPAFSLQQRKRPEFLRFWFGRWWQWTRLSRWGTESSSYRARWPKRKHGCGRHSQAVIPSRWLNIAIYSERRANTRRDFWNTSTGNG